MRPALNYLVVYFPLGEEKLRIVSSDSTLAIKEAVEMVFLLDLNGVRKRNENLNLNEQFFAVPTNS